MNGIANEVMPCNVRVHAQCHEKQHHRFLYMNPHLMNGQFVHAMHVATLAIIATCCAYRLPNHNIAMRMIPFLLNPANAKPYVLFCPVSA
jgi:hypothetical protein